MSNYASYRAQLEGLPLPAAILDHAMFEANMKSVLARAGHKPVRIASKSLRSLGVLQDILAFDPRFCGVMAYHGQEALYLARRGIQDILMGYPVTHKGTLRQIAQSLRQGHKICLMVDSAEHLALLAQTGREENTTFPICVDVDLSDHYPLLHFGVYRSQITTTQQLAAHLRQIKNTPHVQLEGLMGYEAQVAGLGNQQPGARVQNVAVSVLQVRARRRARERRAQAVRLIKEMGWNLRFVNGGGTGSLESTAAEPDVTEVTAGSAFFGPHLFDNYSHFQHQPALFYAIEVVRKPTPQIVTCHGGGFIASGKLEPTKQPQVYLPRGGALLPNEGAGEVQTPVRFAKPQPSLSLGDPVFLRHAKAGELCERFNHLLVLHKDGRRTLTTYRGDGLSFG